MRHLTVILVTVALISSAFINKTINKDETAEFKVSGVCDMCKERIEDAAYLKGVKLAEWNQETQKIKVVFKTGKVTLDQIHKAIAAVGHDTETTKASDEAYKKLPDCCAYRDGVEPH